MRRHEFDDDDFEIINGKPILKDGRTFRTPVRFMDSPQRIAAADADARQRVAEAYRERNAYYEDAWRAEAPATRADDAATAYDQRSEWLANAWRSS
jgi:hypothetical protein